MKNCAFVVRVSDPRQCDDDQKGTSNQRKQLDRYVDFVNAAAEEKGLEQLNFFDTYSLEGVSGRKSFDNEEFKRLRRDIERGSIQVVMATGLDRFGRNVKKFLEFFEFIQEHDVDLVVTHYQIDTASPTGKLIITILMALAEMQSFQIGKKQLESRQERNDEGIRGGGSIPLGYDYDPKKSGIYVINKKEAEIVKLIFKLYREYRSPAKVAQILNSKGYKTKIRISSKGNRRGGRIFTGQSVHYILNNLTYCGYIEVHKANKNMDQATLSENKKYRVIKSGEKFQATPVIIPEEEFSDMQKLLHSSAAPRIASKRSEYPYLLSSLVRCEFCKKPMEADKGRDTSYYACSNKRCPGRPLMHAKYPRLSRNTIPAPALEGAVRELIRDQILQDEKKISNITKQANKAISSELPGLKNELQRLREWKLENDELLSGTLVAMNRCKGDGAALSRLEKTMNGCIEKESEITASINEQEKEVDRGKKKLVTEENVFTMLDTLVRSSELFPPHQQKDLFEMFFSKIVVGLKDIKVVLYLPALQYCKKRSGPNGSAFDSKNAWHARRDSNPKPSGP